MPSLPGLPFLLLLLCVALATLASAQQQSPVITSISGCVDVGNTTTQCSFPVVLTVRGSGLFSGANFTSNPLYSNSPCLFLRVSVAESALAVKSGWAPPPRRAQHVCNDTYFEWQLTYWGYSMYQTGVELPLTVLTGTGAAASFTGLTIAPFSPPAMTGVSGCPSTSADGLSTSSCLPERDLLTGDWQRLLYVEQH